MKTKKILATAVAGLMVMASLAGCGNSGSNTGSASAEDNSSFDKTAAISVITREDGSGTRSAFVELTGVQEEKDGQKQITPYLLLLFKAVHRRFLQV